MPLITSIPTLLSFYMGFVVVFVDSSATVLSSSSSSSSTSSSTTSTSSSRPYPPSLTSLTGNPRWADDNPRDAPTITNFWGSVGSTLDDMLGLSQILLPPYVDIGLTTSKVTTNKSTIACSPENMGPYLIGVSEQFFYLVSSTPTLRTYNLTCVSPGCTSWHNATATMPYPFNAFHIIFQEIPPHTPFSDDGIFDSSCTIVNFQISGGEWCASNENPQCIPENNQLTVESWQWSPTSILKTGEKQSLSETRMLFENNGVLQQFSITADPDNDLENLTINLQGAIRSYGGLSWTTGLPQDGKDFQSSLISNLGKYTNTTGMLTCDTKSPACSLYILSSVIVTFSDGSSQTVTGTTNTSVNGISFSLSFPSVPSSATLTVSLALIVDSSVTNVTNLAFLVADYDSFVLAWNNYPFLWEQRWLDAFTPKPLSSSSSSSYHFSGNLPILQFEETLTGTALTRLYYMSVLSILLMERTNLPALYPRVYLTGTGNALCGMDIGGTMQFAWDQTFYGTLQALLDPEAQSIDLQLWIGQPIDKIFGVELDNLQVGGDFYAFNALSLYRAFSTYIRTTNNVTFLSSNVNEYLDTLADFYQAYTGTNSTLADYSGLPNNYLECVPSYRHATAGLQGGNAYMAYDLADLRTAQQNTSGANTLRTRAQTIGIESLGRMYISSTNGNRNGTNPGDIGGWFRVIDTSAGGQDTTEVRHVVDFAYATMGFCSPRWPGTCIFNDTVRSQMLDYVQRQLIVPGGAWMRALSPLDSVAPISRPDHGSTGAYDAWPAITFDAIVSLDQGFSLAASFLANLAVVTDEGPMGQAHAIQSDGISVFKTTGGCNRYIANNGAAFGESILRYFFGYEPTYIIDSSVTNVSNWVPLFGNVSRGITGTLSCIRGPLLTNNNDNNNGTTFLYLTSTLTMEGIAWEWSTDC